MLSDVKNELINNPEALRGVLEHFDFANIKIYEKYLSFGRDCDSSPKSIVIYLNNNDYLYVKDYPRNVSKDLFSYIMETRGVTFKDVISAVNTELGITDYTVYFGNQKKQAFGGYYSKIKKSEAVSFPKLLDNAVLEAYPRVGNLTFLTDNISLSAQKYFDIRYDILNDGIVIPILDQFGSLIGVKERVNHVISEDGQKYWYLYPCRMSLTLYGFAQNYNYLCRNKVLIFEAEKSVMQCYSYGIHNAVALGSGTLSRNQIKMLYEIQPTEIIFLHDVGYGKENIVKNIDNYRKLTRFSDARLGYWDWSKSGYTEKYSPSDLGKNELKRILDEEIIYV